MDRSRDVLGLKALLYGWLAAGVALPLTLLLAVVGQGIGSWLGGCGWIGLSLPVHRQVWALVNQPTLAFATEARALGYWLGSLTLLLLVAALLVPLMPRSQTLAAELLTLQVAWAAATVGLAWLPLLDLDDGHLARWLALHRLSHHLVWVAPVLGALASLVPSLHLLALLAGARRHAGRLARLGTVTLSLGLPLAAWVGLVSLLRGAPAVIPTLALAPPLLLALALAWVGLPRPHVLPLAAIAPASLVRAFAALLLLGALVAVAGRPLPDGRSTGLLWRRPTDTNNVRPWIKPVRVLGAREAASNPGR
jgi:hypothetical protein